MYRQETPLVTQILCCRREFVKENMMSYKEEKKYVGNLEQLFKVKKIELQEGKAKGVAMLDVQNRSGMHFDVDMSRGMDIPHLDFQGENIGFISPCGVVAPEYFDDKELGFLKSFTAGFLTTCGLKLAGAPCEYEGQSYGLHGNISHIPVENSSYEIVEEEVPYVEIKGTVKDSIIFGDKLKLERKIRCYYKERKFRISDTVTNEGYQKVRHMILYHCNIGYPILSPESEVYIPALKTIPRNEHAKEGLDTWMKLEKANPNYEEMCYYHTLKPNAENHAIVAVYNPKLELGIALDIDLSTLDHFVQWKMMGAGDYVMGLEPGNSTIDGIADAVQNGSIKYLKPGEQVHYEINVQILKGREAFEAVKIN